MKRWMEEWCVRKDARRGSTLGWVIMVMMVMMVLLMSALAMSASHIYRYQRYHNRRQIHMTAISVAGAIAGELEHPSGEGGFWGIMERMLEDSEEGEVFLSGLEEEMGEVCIRYWFDGEQHLLLEVQVQMGRETGQTKVAMRRGSLRGDETPWKLLGYGAEEMDLDDYGSGEDGEFAAE